MNPSWRKNYIRYRSYFLNVLSTYKKRESLRVYLEIILSLVTVILFSVFALRPTFLTIGKLIKEIEVKRETINTMDEKISNLAEAQALHDQYLNQISLLDTAVPGEPQPDVFVRQIEGLSQKNTLNISTLSMEKTTIKGSDAPPDDTGELPIPENANFTSFSVGATGDPTIYPQLSSFFTDLTQLRLPIKIDEVIFTASEGLDKSLSIVISGKIPYLRGIKN